MLTVNQLAIRLATDYGESTDNTEYISTLETWINDALDEIAVKTDWKFFQATGTFNTVATQRLYNMPIGLRDIRVLRFTEFDTPIDFVTKPQIAQLGIDFEQSGRPQKWYAEDYITVGSNLIYRIGLWPVPDAIYSIENDYLFHPSDIASASNITVPDELYTVIKYKIGAEQGDFDNNFERYDRKIQRFDKMLADITAKYNRSSSQWTRLQPRDISSSMGERFARLDPAHFRN